MGETDLEYWESQPHRNQAIRLGIRQRTQQYRIHHAKDGGGSADAEAQRQNGRHRESGPVAQRPQGVPN